MRISWTASCAWVVVFSALLSAAARAEDKDPARQLAIIQAAAPSLARVEYTLQYDKGEPPAGAGWGQRCPNCGQIHGSDGSEVVTEERPLEMPAFVLSPTQVISPDFMIHPRFVKSIAVRFGDQVVEATVASWCREQNATLLQLKQPLTAAKPLAFTKAKGPYWAVTYTQDQGQWNITAQSLPSTITAREDGQRFIAAPSPALIVDGSGAPVAMSMKDELPLDDSWQVSPLQWPLLSAADRERVLADVQKAADATILRVALSFRSPRKGAEPAGRMSRFSPEDEDGATERNVLGIMLDDRRILVLAGMKPNITARLERVAVHPATGDPIPAKFASTLADYECFVATLDKPLPGSAPIAAGDIRQHRNRMLLTAKITLQGEKRVCYFGHTRIASFELGWRRQVLPNLASRAPDTFVFDDKGQLVVAPIGHREKVSVQQRWSSSSPTMTPLAYVSAALTDLARNTDPGNVPLSEEEENRIAWLGVELQPLNRELARANNVSDLTTDGQSGALVSFVYPDSPAAKAGIVQGDILLRLHFADQPKPLDVQVEAYSFADRPFPWDQLDELPEQYFDQIPQPWPTAESVLTRTLTDLGFGKKFQAEFFRDGKVILKDFEVVPSPAHFTSAPKTKVESLGLTMRDMTYEVRRYFQRKDIDPGVVIASIEPGSRASRAGMKPYEYVTHVNDTPVVSAKQFAELVEKQKDLRLSVRRMTKGRLVRLTLDGPASRPATKPVEASADR